MACIIFGAFLYAFIIGDFSNLLKNISQERDEFDAKMRLMNDLLAYIDAPAEVRDKVQDFHDFKYNNKEGSTSLIDELPASLQVELVKQRYGDLIGRVPFFVSLHDRAKVYLCKKFKSFTLMPGDMIMTKGDWHDELLILSKGQAKTTKNSRGEENTAVYVPSSPRSEDISEYTLYEPGTFWGEMQFLGLQKQRTLGVVAIAYCEIASLSPQQIAPTSSIYSRLSAYAEMRQEVEAKILVGESVDISVLQTQLEERYRAMAANESDQPQHHHHHQPQLPDLKPALPVESSEITMNAVMGEMQAMQLSQRQTDTQLSAIATQLKELTVVVSALKPQRTGS